MDLGSNVLNFKKSIVGDAKINIVVKRKRGAIAMVNKIEIGENVYLKCIWSNIRGS